MTIQQGEDILVADFEKEPTWEENKSIRTKSTGNIDWAHLVIPMTAGETLSASDWVYLAESDNKLYKADATYNDERTKNVVGIIRKGGNEDETVLFQRYGVIENLSGLTEGDDYYISTTAGEITNISQGYAKKIGKALSSTRLLIHISDLKYTSASTSSSNEKISGSFTIEADQLDYTLEKEYEINKAAKQVTFFWHAPDVGKTTVWYVQVRKWDGSSESTIDTVEDHYNDGPTDNDITINNINEGDTIRIYAKTTDTSSSITMENASIRFKETKAAPIFDVDDLSVSTI